MDWIQSICKNRVFFYYVIINMILSPKRSMVKVYARIGFCAPMVKISGRLGANAKCQFSGGER